jgi:hypothetical protein
MINHRLRVTLCTAVTPLLLAGAAHAATFTAKVDPPAAGTAQSPQPHTTTLSLTNIAPGLGGNAKVALATLVESLPADFQTTMTQFATCPAANVVHGDNKPQCPDASVLGHVTATAYVPSLAFNTHSDAGYIWKIGDNRVGTWVHVSHPIGAGIAVYGTVDRGAAPFGPTVTWDMKPLAIGAQTGAEVRINDLTFSWEQTAAAPAASADASISKRQSCQAKARRINNKRKRAAALRRCAKVKKPKPKPKPQPSPTSPAPFVSIGCSTGNWPFRAQLTFIDNTTETQDATVTCQP